MGPKGLWARRASRPKGQGKARAMEERARSARGVREARARVSEARVNTE